MAILGLALTLGGLVMNMIGVVFFIAAAWHTQERLFEASNPRVGSGTVNKSSPAVKLGIKANRQALWGLWFVMVGFLTQAAGAIASFLG